jgi:hypothetical protein
MSKDNTSWLDIETSLFQCVADNKGRPRTFRQILFSDFAILHEWFFKTPDKWINDNSNDLDTIIGIRQGVAQEDKNLLKQTLQCYTPSALFGNKKKGSEEIISYTNILQLDFDNLGCFDIDEVKQVIFQLPFVCYVGKSVSGKGLFALILISEPERLKQYAEHCFIVFGHYGLLPDTTKGRNYSDLRFVSYDSNALCRDNPKPLTVKRFYTDKRDPITKPATVSFLSDNALLNHAVKQIQQAEIGQRFETVRKWSYTLGGHSIGLGEIKQAINNSPQYSGLERKYLIHADECFAAGQEKPIISHAIH